MARRRRQEESGGGSPGWLTTYSDLVTLLLCFFILLFSFSNVDAEKFRSIMASFQGGSGVLEGGTSLDIPINTIEDYMDIEADLKSLIEHLDEYAETLGLGERLEIKPEERGIVIRFMDNVLFDSGSAEIKPGSLDILKSVAEMLNREEFSNRQIKVEGHTDSDQIIRSSKFPTNWELSSARATNVLRYLVEVENIEGNRVSSSGYSYYRPILPNDSPENKAKNRRVDIVILKDSYEELEP
ncbi:OmpA/MotB family protein [Tissierella praeacuta]|uniref:Chemotaxis protein MotB n=1 Tax=Tissierella praeacuta DSM 18095 TaxID=1123404 RepID=A0A1M4SLE8_9FIRM|nr:flagellar motor protein MotB [Tissierella praeacuta]TCU70582.1 chemotaxis protein MotB [Tissierella praeacuta]SHE32982.1 chemotaxis protein MotB [Tissierella praeacuta DSM 18095]SUP01539.1 Chemotaxis protein MotB [Tissierella praeacuta]